MEDLAHRQAAVTVIALKLYKQQLKEEVILQGDEEALMLAYGAHFGSLNVKTAASSVDQLNIYVAMGCFHVLQGLGVHKFGYCSPQHRVKFDELQDVGQEDCVDIQEGLVEIQEVEPENLVENEGEEEADQAAGAGMVVAGVGEDPSQTENYNSLGHTSQYTL